MTDAKILIIEDDADQLIGLKLRLESHNYRVVHATDAVSAVRVARQAQPDVILLDIGLPAGDGFMVMERLHNLIDIALIPIIIISARDPELHAERALNEGAHSYFQKPVDNRELINAIEDALGITA